MKLLGLACCPVLLAVEVYRRGWCAPLILGAGMWADAVFGFRPNYEPDVIG